MVRATFFLIIMGAAAHASWAWEKIPNTTVFLPLQTDGCTDDFCKNVSSRIKSGLSDIPHLRRIDSSKTESMQVKSDASRLSAVAKGEGVHRIVKGSIRRFEKTYRKQAGGSEGKEYLLEKAVYEWYIVHIELIEVDEGKLIAKFDEKIERKDIGLVSSKINHTLKKYFLPRWQAKAPMIPSLPEVIYHKEKKVEEKKPEKSPYLFSLSGMGSFLLSDGRFNKVTDYCIGAKVSGAMEHFFVHNSVIQFCAGYYFGNSKSGKSDSYSMVPLSLQLGYSFQLFSNFKIAPHLGGGYIFHFVTSSGSTNQYRDPLVQFGLNCIYAISDRYAIFFLPGYNIFFEKENIGRYYTFDAGMRYTF